MCNLPVKNCLSQSIINGKAERTDKDLEALESWLSEYNPSAWNGESWDIDDGKRLFPVYTDTEPDEYEITGYEIR